MRPAGEVLGDVAIVRLALEELRMNGIRDGIRVERMMHQLDELLTELEGHVAGGRVEVRPVDQAEVEGAAQ